MPTDVAAMCSSEYVTYLRRKSSDDEPQRTWNPPHRSRTFASAAKVRRSSDASSRGPVTFANRRPDAHPVRLPLRDRHHAHPGACRANSQPTFGHPVRIVR